MILYVGQTCIIHSNTKQRTANRTGKANLKAPSNVCSKKHKRAVSNSQDPRPCPPLPQPPRTSPARPPARPGSPSAMTLFTSGHYTSTAHTLIGAHTRSSTCASPLPFAPFPCAVCPVHCCVCHTHSRDGRARVHIRVQALGYVPAHEQLWICAARYPCCTYPFCSPCGGGGVDGVNGLAERARRARFQDTQSTCSERSREWHTNRYVYCRQSTSCS